MVAGYTRQAAANIQPGLRANAEDCNAEWNQIAAAFDNTGGHDHSGSVAGDGLKIPLGSAVTGVLPIANGGSGSSTNTPATFQVNPGGVLVGAAGSVPTAGQLTLNQNTVVPAAGISNTGIYVVGPDIGGGGLTFDDFSNTASGPQITARKARGTAAAPLGVASGDFMFSLGAQGRDSTGAYSGTQAAVTYQATETWSGTGHGVKLDFITTAAGTTALVQSLELNGNTATFSGAVNAASTVTSSDGTQGIFALGAASARIYSNASTMQFFMGTGNGEFDWYNGPGTQIARLVNTGDLVITGNNATKATGTVWINPSSRDIKQNIRPYDQGLQAVLALNPVTYSFNEASGFPTDGEHIGLVHDETAHMPEMHRTATLGQGDDAREVDALDCSAITFALVNAVKTLKAELDEVRAKLGAA